LTFTDQRAALGLPELFDEGIKFLDWNNDGFLDLVIHNPFVGPRLFEFTPSSGKFVERNVFSVQAYTGSFGVNVYDLNNDGLEDVITSGGNNCNTVVHLNTRVNFVRTYAGELDSLCTVRGAATFGDLNKDGRIDLIAHEFFSSPQLTSFLNGTQNQNG